jgi:hypothetical protein
LHLSTYFRFHVMRIDKFFSLNHFACLRFLFASAISMARAMSPYFKSERRPKVLSSVSISFINMSDSLKLLAFFSFTFRSSILPLRTFSNSMISTNSCLFFVTLSFSCFSCFSSIRFKTSPITLLVHFVLSICYV